VSPRRGYKLACALLCAAGLSAAGAAQADVEPPAPAREVTLVDRVAVRYTTPETGGVSRVRVLTERELVFLGHIEAVLEGVEDPSSERTVRAAAERAMADDMLSALLVRRGTEPMDLERTAKELREELCLRLSGCAELSNWLRAAGLSESELREMLLVKGRALFYVHRFVAPVMRPTEEELREAFRTTPSPFREGRFEDIRAQFARFLVFERMRLAEVEFFQAARNRVRVAYTVPVTTTRGRM
jgi:hypothetical protein